MSLASPLARPSLRGQFVDADFDLASLGAALWRARYTILRPTLIVALLTFGVVMLIPPKYQSEARVLIVGRDKDHARRALQLAGVATGCAANFAWRGNRRTRPEYHPDEPTAALLRTRGMAWASDFETCADEVHALFRIREWGHE